MIKEVISLSKKVEKEENQYWEELGLDKTVINLSDAKTVQAILAASEVREEELKKYLESRSNEDLAAIEAVMYGGINRVSIKGRAHPLDEMLQSFRGHTRQSRLHAITQKAPLHSFLVAGMKAYK